MTSLAPVTTDEFHLTEREFARGLRHLARHNRSIRIVAAISPLLVLIGVVTGNVLAIVPGIALLLALVFTWCASPGMQWRRNAHRADSQQFTFAEDQIVVLTPTTRGEVGWDYYADVVESQDVYVLLGANKLCNVLPRRAFPSPADEERFRLLVARQRDAGRLGS